MAMPTNNTPKTALVRLGVAAQAIGVTPEHLAKGLLDGTVPLRVMRVAQTTFLRTAELNAWLRDQPAPAQSAYDLF